MRRLSSLKVSNACPACYHAWRELPRTPAFARQHQVWRRIRKGTQTLDSGIARAELLHDHGVRPHFVGKVLRAEVDRSRQVLATMAVSRPTVNSTCILLTEHCCHPDSSMSAAWMASGGQPCACVCRTTYDVSRPWEVMRIGALAKAAMDHGLNMRLHAALPCTPWSALTHTPAAISHTYRVRRERQRNQSRKMLKLLVALFNRLRGQKFGASFEWPAYCDGCPEIQNLIRELPVRCMFDGCAYGLRSRQGVPLRKPWRAQSSCPRHAALLSDRCPGPRAHLLHERTSGREAQCSERYTPLTVKRLIAGLLAPSARRAIVEHSGYVLENEVPDEPASGHQLLLAVKKDLALDSRPSRPPGTRTCHQAQRRFRRGSLHRSLVQVSFVRQASRTQASQSGTSERPVARLR